MSKLKSILLKKALLPIADIAMKTCIVNSYRQLQRMRSYSMDEIDQWQNEQLIKLVHHAYNHTKYYNRLFTQKGLLPEDIKSISDLEKLPILTKDIIRENFNDIIADNINSIPSIKSATGGSTGNPLIYYQDNRSWSMCNANNILNWEKVGYKYGDPYVALGSSSLFVNKSSSLKHRIYYQLKSKIGLNGVNMSDEICSEYIALIRNKKINYIYGYASAIYLLANYSLVQNELLKIRACFPTSEVLTDHFRNTIQQAFQCKVLDCYGANDGGITSYAHEKGFFEVGYNCMVQLQNKDQTGYGSALLTDLFNFALPFINYKLGDEIQIEISKNKDYPYNGQVINNIHGRSSDIIQLENGHNLTGPGFTVLFKDLPVEHFCIRKTGINTIECSIIKLPDFSQNHEDIIKSTFYKQMGDNTTLNIIYSTEIPLTKSGKRQYFKN
ncbi:MAG: hypothetical protein ACOYNC_13740 [Bacteroidales bacterium]